MGKILSVSVAAYNVEKYISRVFDILTISNNVNKKIEIIVVNDGSKDVTVNIAKKFQCKYPDSIVIIDKQNGGYGSTINAAIEVATGKYFKILDGDDWFEKDNIPSFLEFLEQCDKDVVISPYKCVYESDNKTELVDRHKTENYSLPLHMHEICVNTNLYRKSKIKIMEHCFYTDTEYAINVMNISSNASKFMKPIYCYRIGREGQSVSNEGRIKHILDSEKVALKCADKFRNSGTKYNEAIKKQVAISILFHYRSLALFSSQDAVRRIKEFDKKLYQYSRMVYTYIGKSSRVIKLLRIIRFSPSFLVIKLLR